MKLSKKDIVSRTLTIKTLGVEVPPNKDGLYNLNVLWQQAKLPECKRPSDWTNEIRKLMEVSSNIRRLKNENQGKGEAATYLYGTEQGLYAYCMWVSPEFYLKVVEAFTALVNGDIVTAQRIANDLISVHEVMLKKVKGYDIAKYIECFSNIADATECFIKAMHNNPDAEYKDRVDTLKALERVVAKSFDNLSARDLNATAQHNLAEKLIKAEGQRIARIANPHKH